MYLLQEELFITFVTDIFDRQCSECTKSSSGDSEVETKDLDAPRKLREKIKEPTKWSPDMKFKFEFEKVDYKLNWLFFIVCFHSAYI